MHLSVNTGIALTSIVLFKYRELFQADDQGTCINSGNYCGSEKLLQYDDRRTFPCIYH